MLRGRGAVLLFQGEAGLARPRLLLQRAHSELKKQVHIQRRFKCPSLPKNNVPQLLQFTTNLAMRPRGEYSVSHQ